MGNYSFDQLFYQYTLPPRLRKRTDPWLFDLEFSVRRTKDSNPGIWTGPRLGMEGGDVIVRQINEH